MNTIHQSEKARANGKPARSSARSLWLASAIPFILFASDAAAQNVLMDEIVVTAQKREENIQNVPLAVSAFSGDQLKAMNIQVHDPRGVLDVHRAQLVAAEGGDRQRHVLDVLLALLGGDDDLVHQDVLRRRMARGEGGRDGRGDHQGPQARSRGQFRKIGFHQIPLRRQAWFVSA